MHVSLKSLVFQSEKGECRWQGMGFLSGPELQEKAEQREMKGYAGYLAPTPSLPTNTGPLPLRKVRSMTRSIR
jgi:hypothetical protein